MTASSTDRIIRFAKDDKEFEVGLSREGTIGTQQIGLMFQLLPQTVWLKSRFSNRTYWPEGGVFDLSSVEPFSLLVVEGASSPAPSTEPVPEIRPPTNTMSSTPTTSRNPLTPTWPSFSSIVNSQTKGLHRKKGSANFTLKVVVATMNFVDGGKKPSFEQDGAVHVSLSDSTATLPHVLSAVRNELGEEYIIVTSDGFEIKDSPGTQGFSFWKANARKFFAVQESELDAAHSSSHSRKRRIVPSEFTSNAEDTATHAQMIKVKEEILAAMKESNDTLLKITKDSKIPLGLKQLLSDALKCTICRGPIQPPIVLAKCCKTIFGCEDCVNHWYSGEDITTKKCPRCNEPRGYCETMRLLGLDELASGVKRILGAESGEEE